MFLGKKIFMGKQHTGSIIVRCFYPDGGVTYLSIPVFHYPHQKATVYDRSSLKLIKADAQFPKLTKSDYIKTIDGRIHLLSTAMIEEGRDGWML